MKERKMKMKKKRFLAFLLAGAMIIGGAPVHAQQETDEALPAPQVIMEEELLPYQDTSLTFEERAADLVSRMTLSEKALQTIMDAAAIPRLGVKAYNYWSEGLHGVARSGAATSFPTGLGIGSTWNAEMTEQMAAAIGDEARGYSNGKGKGLSYWSPTINMTRDPRWGRLEEGYGEDPYLTAMLGERYVHGMQGDDEKYLKTIATLKHFMAYNSEYNRHNGSSEVDDRDLREYYTYAFKDIVETQDVASVMSSYNRVNGIPMAANTYWLTDVLRNTWGFDGYVTSDCWAITDIWQNHKWQPEGYSRAVNATEATALSIKAGNDINCGNQYHVNVQKAIEQGLMTEDDLDKALVRMFTARMKTGEFDPKESVPYCSDQYSYEKQVENMEHKQLAEDMADESLVLLQNKDSYLPLKGDLKKIVIVGALADACNLGDYSGNPSEANRSTPVQGITAAAKRAMPDAQVTFIDSDGTKDVSSYLMNVQSVTLNYGANNAKKMQVKDAAEHNACVVESNDNKNIGYISSGAYIRYDNIDLADLSSAGVEMAGAKTDAFRSHVEFHLDAPDGQKIAEMTPEYTSGWQNYVVTTGDVSLNGASGKHSLYVTFTYAGADDVSFTAQQEAQIREADVVVVFSGTRTVEEAIGSNVSDSAEEKDRETIDLPRNQGGTVLKCAQLNPNTVSCIQTVGQVNIEEIKEAVPSILWCSYNGQAQGNAFGRALFGESNPSGKIPFTWYTSLYDLDPVGIYDIRADETSNGRTYQYFTGRVTYPFGYGMSYTDFAYSNFKIDKTSVASTGKIKATVDVKNTGAVKGKEVVELYVISPKTGKDRPIKRLRGFDKVELAPGETKTVTIELDISSLSYWDDADNRQVFDLGEYTVQASSSSAEADVEGSAKFTLTAEDQAALKCVTLSADKVSLDAETAETAKTEVTAAMTDDSFHAVVPGEAVYSSSNENAAVVAADGTITAVGTGTAVITASVTVDGVTKTSDVAVAVKGKEPPVSAYRQIAGGSIESATGDARAEDKMAENGYPCMNLGYITKSGCEAVYSNIDFGNSTVKQLQIVTASPADGGADIDVYLDEVKPGNLLAAVKVPAGNGWKDQQKLTAEISEEAAKKASGVHSVHLVVKPTGAGEYATNIVSFQFAALHKVEIEQTANGTVAADKTEVETGQNVTVTATADKGFHLGKLLVNGREAAAENGVFVINGVNQDLVIQAEFAADHQEEPVKPEKPKAPSSVKADWTGEKTVKVTWKKSADAGSYEVYRSEKKSSGYKKIKTVTKSSYTDKSAKAGKTIYYRIKAVKGKDKSGYSNTASAYVVKAPAGLKVTAKNKTVTVSFKKAAKASGYVIYRSAKKNGKYKKVFDLGSAKNVKKTFKKVKKGTYYYKVKAYKKIGKKKIETSYSAVQKVRVK